MRKLYRPQTTKTYSIQMDNFPALLTVLFVGLKLTGHITWGWIWVLSPLWISFILGISVIVLALLLGVGRRR